MNITPQLEQAIEDLIDWLNYIPAKPEDTMPAIKRLRNAYFEAKFAGERSTLPSS